MLLSYRSPEMSGTHEPYEKVKGQYKLPPMVSHSPLQRSVSPTTSSNPMAIDSILNASTSQPSHSRNLSTHSTYLEPSPCSPHRSWTSSPETNSYHHHHRSHSSSSLTPTHYTDSRRSSAALSPTTSSNPSSPSPSNSAVSPRVSSRPNSRASRRASATSRERRAFRPTYDPEEEFFIWYHRDDLAMGWDKVLDAYTRRFPERLRDGVQGIQCKYYRCCQTHGIPTVRQRQRLTPNWKQVFGVRSKAPEVWFDWMERR